MSRIQKILMWVLSPLVALAALILVASGTGTIYTFSPESLEAEFQVETYFPLTEYSVFRQYKRPFEYRLVNYLVDKGYWEKIKKSNPDHVVAKVGTPWQDGHSFFHSNFSWYSSEWIIWTETNPEIAPRFWSLVLEKLRTDPTQAELAELMLTAKMSKSEEALADLVSRFEVER